MAQSKTKSKITRDHEVSLALLKAFAEDPELKYWLGASIGLGATWVSTMFPGGEVPPEGTEPADVASNLYETMFGIGSPLLAATGIFDFNDDGYVGYLGKVSTFAFASFTSWNMACLLLRNMNGGGNGGIAGALSSL